MHPIHGPLIRRAMRRASATTLISAGAIAALIPSSALAATTKTWYVSASATTNPACAAASKTHQFQTIAAALACAKAGDTVRISAGTFAGGFTVPAGVLLDGAGANQTTVSDTTHLNAPEVTIAPGTETELESLAVDGGGEENSGIAAGSGSVILSKVSVTDTFNPSGAGGAVTLAPMSGPGALTVLDSTIANNNAEGSGGIAAGSPSDGSVSVTVIDSTISGNGGGNEAGGIDVINGTLTARDDTISGNGGGAIAGGLDVGPLATATVRDDLIAGNVQGSSPISADCFVSEQGTVTDGGHNLIGVASPGNTGDCGFQDGVNGDVTGTPASPLNPELGPLALNGATTKTQALLRGSPAIGAQSAVDCEASPVSDHDQRGDTRAATSRQTCDIGAYDTAGKGKVLPVSANAKSTPTCATASSSRPFPTLASAVACAQSGDIVKLGPGTFGGGVTLSANIVIEGAGADKTTISNPTTVGPAEITLSPDVSATVEALSIDGSGNENSGILARTGSLVVQRASITDAWPVDGPLTAAPIAVDPSAGNGSLTLLDSTISDSTGAFGGAVFVGAPITSTPTPPSVAAITNSTISGDTGQQASGGVDLSNASLTLRDSTIANNTGNLAGGLYLASPGTATVTNSLIALNTIGVVGDADDCQRETNASVVVDGGNNLVGIESPGTQHDCGFSAADDDVTGTPAAPLDPDLGPLAFNGGTTQTQAPQAGSPAIGAGDAADCEAAPVSDLDQRGDSRAASTRHACDIGAYDTGGA